MTDTNSLRTEAEYAFKDGLYVIYRAMTEAADTIDTLRAQLAEAQKVQGQLLDALTSVMLCELNSMSSRAEMVRITRAAIDAAKGKKNGA